MHPNITHLNYMQHASSATSGQQDSIHQDVGLFRRWSRATIRRWQRRKMIAVLHAMDDYLLRDIGIERHNIERAVDLRTNDERQLGCQWRS